MIKIDRCERPPESLAIEAVKSYGAYNQPDVVRQLKADSNDKCYLCELQGISDPQIEHLRPHHDRRLKERVFDWNNLFYSCPHCNNMKNQTKYEEKILDCCSCNPELFLDHIFHEGHVEIQGKAADENAELTADLIQNCFEKKNTGIREAACQYRVDRLSETMNILYKTLQKYKENPESQKYQRSLRGMLGRRSKFAAFKRYYVRIHLEDYPELKELV